MKLTRKNFSLQLRKKFKQFINIISKINRLTQNAVYLNKMISNIKRMEIAVNGCIVFLI